MSTDILLRLAEVEKSYQQGSNLLYALQKTSLEILKGEFVVVMGTSGSGKTTLLNIIGGMIEPSSGSLYVNGRKLPKGRKNELALSDYRRKDIGIVFQDFNLISAMTVSENIAIPLILEGEEAAVIKTRTLEMLDLIGLEGKAGSRPYELSGGQQQRVALARALIKRPAILLADEPTGNLDFQTSKHILDLLIRIKQSYNQTIIMVTHDPVMAAYGERVLFMHDGEIHQQVSLSESSPEGRREKIISHFYGLRESVSL